MQNVDKILQESNQYISLIDINQLLLDINLLQLILISLMSSTLHIYVLRRGLDAPILDKLKVALLAHSALLIKYTHPQTKAITYHLLQYCSDNTINMFNTCPAPQQNSQSYSFNTFVFTKQKLGTASNPKMQLNPYNLAMIMGIQMFRKDYDMFQHNCHIAQQTTRYQWGLVNYEELSYPKQVNQLNLIRRNDPWGNGYLMEDQKANKVEPDYWYKANTIVFKRIK